MQTTLELFATSYNGSMQGQLIFLSDKSAPPPQIDKRLIKSLYQDTWLSELLAVLRPGVDGNLIGMLFYHDRFSENFITTLVHETKLTSHCPWLNDLPEKRFMAILASPAK